MRDHVKYNKMKKKKQQPVINPTRGKEFQEQAQESEAYLFSQSGVP